MTRHVHGAKKRGWVIDREAVKILITTAEPICACCGVEKPVGGRAGLQIDRINNTFGYLRGNIALLCYRCNRLKNSASLADLRLLVAYAERYSGESLT